MLTNDSIIVNHYFEETIQKQVSNNCFFITASNNIPTLQAFVNTFSKKIRKYCGSHKGN